MRKNNTEKMIRAFSLSLTPGFSLVWPECGELNRFSGFMHAKQTVETVWPFSSLTGTRLKPGVNEKVGDILTN